MNGIIYLVGLRRRGQGVRPVLPRSSVGSAPHGHRHHRCGSRSDLLSRPHRFAILIGAPSFWALSGAAAMSIVLLAFGSALGLSVVVRPYACTASRRRGPAILAAVYLALVMVASPAAGGYIAGRMRTPWRTTDEVEMHFRDGAHGFGVWSVGVLLGAALAASGVGAVLFLRRGRGHDRDRGRRHGRRGVQSGAGPALAEADRPTRSIACLARRQPLPWRRRLRRPWPRRPAPRRPPCRRRVRARASRRRLPASFAAGLANPQLDARDRTYLARVVADETGMSQADAEEARRRDLCRPEGCRAEGSATQRRRRARPPSSPPSWRPRPWRSAVPRPVPVRG